MLQNHRAFSWVIFYWWNLNTEENSTKIVKWVYERKIRRNQFDDDASKVLHHFSNASWLLHFNSLVSMDFFTPACYLCQYKPERESSPRVPNKIQPQLLFYSHDVRSQADGFGILKPSPFHFLDVAFGILELFPLSGEHWTSLFLRMPDFPVASLPLFWLSNILIQVLQ